MRLSDLVILRREPKNLEILRPAQRGTQDDNYFLRGACPERLDPRSSTDLAEKLRMTDAGIRRVVGQSLQTKHDTQKDEGKEPFSNFRDFCRLWVF